MEKESAPYKIILKLNKLMRTIGNICLIIVILSQICLYNTNSLFSNRIAYLLDTTQIVDEHTTIKNIFSFVVRYSPASLIYVQSAILYGLEIVDITNNITYKLSDIENNSLIHNNIVDNSINNRQKFIENIEDKQMFDKTYDLEVSINKLLRLNLRDNNETKDTIETAQNKIINYTDNLIYYVMTSLVITTIGIKRLITLILELIHKTKAN